MNDATRETALHMKTTKIERVSFYYFGTYVYPEATTGLVLRQPRTRSFGISED